MDKKEKKRISIGNKFYFFVGTTVFLAGIVVAILSYLINAARINNYYSELSLYTARYVSTMLDAESILEIREVIESEDFQALREIAEEEDNEQVIEDYLKEKSVWNDYSEIRNFISDYLRTMGDVEYLYLIVCGGKSATHDRCHDRVGVINIIKDTKPTAIKAVGFFKTAV